MKKQINNSLNERKNKMKKINLKFNLEELGILFDALFQLIQYRQEQADEAPEYPIIKINPESGIIENVTDKEKPIDRQLLRSYRLDLVNAQIKKAEELHKRIADILESNKDERIKETGGRILEIGPDDSLSDNDDNNSDMDDEPDLN